MCSLGKVQLYSGKDVDCKVMPLGCRCDIFPSPALAACLRARSFRRELILLTETRLNPAFQAGAPGGIGWWGTFRSLLALGYEHVLLLSLADRCGRSTELWPRLACVWSSQTFVSNTKYLLDRVALLTRAARLGYSVLMLDSDVIPLRDVYVHLKAPPLANVTVATMRDGNGWNARPDGPTAYMLAEIVDRLERWGERPEFVTSRKHPAHCWDQAMYSDTLLSAVAGRPVSYGCWFKHEPREAVNAWHEAHQRVFGTQENGPLETRHYMQAQSHPWPAELLRDFPDYPNRHSDELWTAALTVPNTRGEWPAELGGALYPPQRGPSAQAWMDALRADVLPLWPDPEDPSQMATNNWDWDVAHAVHPNRGVFFASHRSAPLPDVLALSPELERSGWPHEAAFGGAVRALVRLAAEMGRAAAFPAPRCNLSWLGGQANQGLPLAVFHGAHIHYAPPDRGFDDLRCLWGGYLQYGCQAARSYYAGGLLAPEYDHMLQLLRTDRSAAAAASLTALGFGAAATAAVAAAAAAAAGNGAADDVVTVPLELLAPPPGTAAWDVVALAARLMDRYGGPGSGLLLASTNGTGTAGGVRPRVLVLPEVPLLSEAPGPRMELFKRELESGDDRVSMSCEWIRTGRPYRRRGRRRRGR
ncbi:hypothetical protein GPECTOR_2g1523 [Gonium pectorale]|uniref:Nucleotide-diphospho-sugar transferase domain-containing protein n=1 Tax=Gonium pectorale TaxID=33097 RepID=A0A150H1K3_GONPE|nr:hypothetical protein GPECTOR_2g1523 [Gonium pectorale]|eukprot:KXZ55971.1 hypothetical protein GPECTOR_2g1523 [Gonium pectorale]